MFLLIVYNVEKVVGGIMESFNPISTFHLLGDPGKSFLSLRGWILNGLVCFAL